MKKGNRSFKVGKVQAGIFSLLLIFCITIPSYSFVDKSVFKTESLEVPGIAEANNFQFWGRYIITAPFAPSEAVTPETTLDKLDNHYVLILDSKKVSGDPQVIDLKDTYYPTKVHFDAEKQILFIRGTQIVVEDESGEYQARAVIKYLHLNLSDDGKLSFDGEILTIPIEGVGAESVDAPDAFVLSDKFFIFTNGASFSTYSLAEGFLYKVSFITRENYDAATNSITDLNFDTASKVLSVVINKKTKIAENQWKHSSELYFYQLRDENGTVDLLSHLGIGAFPDGVVVSAGSQIAIDWDGKIDPKGEKGENEGYAYFGASDGKLYRTSWKGFSTNEGAIDEIASFDELKQSGGEYLSSVKTSYNKETRTFEVLKNGYTAYIHRPLNTGSGRIGKIHRPLNLRFLVESPALGLAQFGKKNKIISQKTFTTELAEQGGVLNLVSDDSRNRYVATYNGNIFELNLAEGVEKATLNPLGQLGNRLGSVEYLSARKVFVAVNALQLDDAGQEITAPGGIFVAKRQEENNFLSLVNWTEDSLSYNPVLGFAIGSIRRPCNFRFH